MKGAQANAKNMQHAGREYKSHAKSQWFSSVRQFFAVGIAVKDGEQTDNNSGGPQRWPHRECDQEPQHQRRNCDADLDGRDRRAANP